MNKLFRMLLILAPSLSLPGLLVYPQSKPPGLYVDKGACPFECCTYRRWKTLKTTIAYATPYKGSKPVGKFLAGRNVIGMTGVVRTGGSKLVVTKVHEKYKPGDVLWVYTPLGEGVFKVWFKGKMFEQDLLDVDIPFSGAPAHSCDKDTSCWGKVEKELQTDWWVKIKGADGLIGWTNEVDNFDNKDACG